MARASYTCPSCTKSIEVDGRNRKDADSRAAYLQKQNRLCWDCDNRQASEKATAAAQAAGFAPLTGSAKQIAWAETIRVAAIKHLNAEAAEISNRFKAEVVLSDAAMLEISDALALFASEVEPQTEAKFWIDNRDSLYADYLETQFRKRGADLCPTATAESIRS